MSLFCPTHAHRPGKEKRMRSRFAACIRAPPAPLWGAGAPTRERVKRDFAGKKWGRRDRALTTLTGAAAMPAKKGTGATRRSVVKPAHPFGVPRRFAVPSAGFDNAALCGVGKVSGRRASRQVSTACGASNKGQRRGGICYASISRLIDSSNVIDFRLVQS